MTSLPLFLAIAAIGGGFVSLLVSHSLAASIGIAGPWRYLLAVAISFGVISVGVKSIIAYAVTSSDGGLHSEFSSEKLTSGYVPVTEFSDARGYRPWRGLDGPPRSPVSNPITVDKVRLGKALFNDPRLSADGKIACSSCHKLDGGGDDDSSTSIGINGLTGDRNAPTVVNAAYLSRFFWDGRAHSLEEQAKGPLVNPVEMAMPSMEAVVAVVSGDESYQVLFDRAFGEERKISEDTIAMAIAAYERTLYSTDAPYDRFIAGDEMALTAEQKIGMLLFDEKGCRTCHVDPTFSALEIGVYRRFPMQADSHFVKCYDLRSDKGKIARGTDSTSGVWRVPSLRNVAETAPYFHNGSVDELEEAIRVMAAVQLDYEIVDKLETRHEVSWDDAQKRLTRVARKKLTEEEVDAITAFLRSLSVPDS